jgi:adenylate cyclase
MTTTRRLAAILAADAAGYSRLMGADEEGTHERLKAHIHQLVDPKIREHRGRVVKKTGDGILAEFSSVVDAVRSAAEIQRRMMDRNAEIGPDQRIMFRVGINLGDVIVEEDDIYGDGVNIAARLETLAEPGGICVSARVQEDVAGRLDMTFDDLGEQILKNISRPVRVYRVRLDGVKDRPTVKHVNSAPPLTLPDKPSIAVLPFQNMSGDPEQEYFADGMVEEIITALSRIKWLFVIARNSSFTYKGQSVDVKRVGRELGVRYVLEGSVRKAGQRVRITAQLIDAVTDAHLWADRFDGSLEDVFELQDNVALTVAGVIEPTLQDAEMRHSAARPTTDPTAYDLYLRARSMVQSTSEALRLMEQATERDSNYGPALAWSAICYMLRYQEGRSEDPKADSHKGVDLARRALQVGGEDPDILANSAFVLAYFGEDITAMMALADRALVLNPSFARGWHISGILRVWAGQSDLGIERVETALSLSPRARIGWGLMVIGMAHFLSRRFDQAVPKLLLATQEDPGYLEAYRYLAACYASMGRIAEARKIIERLHGISPALMPSINYLRNAEQRELYRAGLLLAMSEAT